MNPLPILRDSWYFFRRHLPAIARLCLPLVALECLARYWLVVSLGDGAPPYADLLIGLLFYPVYTAALILFLDARSRGVEPRNRELLASALALWPRLALLTALSSLLIMLGASLFLLPGLWAMIKLCFAEYLLVLDRQTPLGALQDSFRLTSGRFWLILFSVLAVMVPLWAFDWRVFPLLGTPDESLLPLLVDCLRSFLQLFASVVVFRLYMLARPEAYVMRPAE
ncbi:hypothetical protein [Zestomonas thermotolerans]|uniref:hypothetical protein n=1 Tax=Zestomonas thermotolerans TaxID=157784 RepID=UPI0023F4B25E|nr:hypothetical protein [Pseudomonas thermotolerans]MBO2510141.1 hypothetical protein [Gammaproteobacteria bacterium]